MNVIIAGFTFLPMKMTYDAKCSLSFLLLGTCGLAVTPPPVKFALSERVSQ